MSVIERRRQIRLMSLVSWTGMILAAFGLGSYLAAPDRSRGLLIWVALWAAFGVGFQLLSLRQMMRGKHKGTA